MRLILCLLLTISLGLLSKAHMPLQDAVDLTAFAMPDGTLPVLCLDGGADHSKSGHCPDCQGGALVALPIAYVIWHGIPRAYRPALPAPMAIQRAEIAPQARGPPSVLM